MMVVVVVDVVSRRVLIFLLYDRLRDHERLTDSASHNMLASCMMTTPP